MVLNVNRASRTYTKAGVPVHALADVSLTVEAGEFVAVQGKSGCGKSTLLLTAGGLLAPDHGAIAVCDQDLYQMRPEARARFRARTIGFVFQQFHLIPYLSVLENVLAPALALGTEGVRQRAEELIERFGLASRSNHVPAELSTGERQRTAFARALLNRPKLVLADEPTGNLDPDNAAGLLADLVAFAREGASVLLVTHDQQAASHAQRCIRLEQGRMVGA